MRIRRTGLNKAYKTLWIAWAINIIAAILSTFPNYGNVIWWLLALFEVATTTICVFILFDKNGQYKRAPKMVNIAGFSTMFTTFLTFYAGLF